MWFQNCIRIFGLCASNWYLLQLINLALSNLLSRISDMTNIAPSEAETRSGWRLRAPESVIMSLRPLPKRCYSTKPSESIMLTHRVLDQSSFMKYKHPRINTPRNQKQFWMKYKWRGRLQVQRSLCILEILKKKINGRKREYMRPNNVNIDKCPNLWPLKSHLNAFETINSLESKANDNHYFVVN